jgi:hypothetical protein
MALVSHVMGGNGFSGDCGIGFSGDRWHWFLGSLRRSSSWLQYWFLKKFLVVVFEF